MLLPPMAPDILSPSASADAGDSRRAWLQDEERTKVGLNQVPSVDELNDMLARTPDELQLFQRLDRELDWPSPANGKLAN